MDIWCIGYEDSCRGKLFRDMCLRAAPQIEAYRLANGQPPKNLEQFGFVETFGLGFEYADTTNHNHRSVDFIYHSYPDGTFVFETMGGMRRFISKMDTSWFLYYDDETEGRVVELVRPRHEFIRFKKK